MGANLLNLNITSAHNISNEVVIQTNVFNALMMHGIRNEMNNTLTITIYNSAITRGYEL